jgi:hypothetical protein
VNKSLAAGKHEIVFDTSNLPEGNYYYTVINGSHRLSGVMMKKI